MLAGITKQSICQNDGIMVNGLVLMDGHILMLRCREYPSDTS